MALRYSLTSKNFADQRQSAEALGELGADAVEAVPDLIQAFRGASWGSEQDAETEALVAITGQDFGRDADAWQQWWEGQE